MTLIQRNRKTEITHGVGLAADRPNAAEVLPGTLYYSTDTEELERSDGAVWSAYAAVDAGGDVVGPGSATDNAITRYDGTTGKLIQNSSVLVADSGQLMFEGSTSSYPSLKRSTVILETKLADDSAYAQHNTKLIGVVDGITAPSAISGLSLIYVDSSDNVLKVIYDDSTIRYLAPEQGTWIAADTSGASLALAQQGNGVATYNKMGNKVYVSVGVQYPATASGAAAVIGVLPWTISATTTPTVNFSYQNTGLPIAGYGGAGTTNIVLINSTTNVAITNAQLSGKTIYFDMTYFT